MHFPLMVELEGALAVVIGGGRVALRKCRQLRSFGARVRVTAPRVCPELEELEGAEVRLAPYDSSALEGAVLAVAATEDHQVNLQVYQDCRDRGIPVNVCDVPQLCTFFFPALVRRGELVLAVSTGGKSPALAAEIRQELEARYGPEEGERVELLGRLRQACRSLPPEERRALALEAARLPLEQLRAVWARAEEGAPLSQILEGERS